MYNRAIESKQMTARPGPPRGAVGLDRRRTRKPLVNIQQQPLGAYRDENALPLELEHCKVTLQAAIKA